MEQAEQLELVSEISKTVKATVETLFDKFYVPKIDHYIDTLLQRHIEQVIEKKIEERFAFAIELLHSMNEKAKANGTS